MVYYHMSRYLTLDLYIKNEKPSTDSTIMVYLPIKEMNIREDKSADFPFIPQVAIPVKTA